MAARRARIAVAREDLVLAPAQLPDHVEREGHPRAGHQDLHSKNPTALALAVMLALVVLLAVPGGYARRRGGGIPERHGHVDSVEGDGSGRALDVIERRGRRELQLVPAARRRTPGQRLQVS